MSLVLELWKKFMLEDNIVVALCLNACFMMLTVFQMLTKFIIMVLLFNYVLRILLYALYENIKLKILISSIVTFETPNY